MSGFWVRVRPKFRFPTLLVVLVGIVLAGCDRSEPPATETIRPVRTQVISLQQIELVGAYPGEIRPHIESTLAFQVGGKLVQRLVQAGDAVKAGQVLARIDPQDLELAESAARAELAAAEVERSRTAADLARYSELRESGFISKAEFDQRKAAHDAAVARVAQARAALKGQSNRADYSVLHADADGVVTGVDAEVGQVVGAGQPVVRVARTADKEVAFLVPEGRLQTVRSLGSATVTLWTGGPPMQATVSEISATADPATRAFPARVRLHDAPDSVQFGMTATVRFTLPVEQPLAQVPLSALLREGERAAVWVLDPDFMTVSRQAVEVRTMTDTQAVLAPGLRDGLEIVTAGVHLLRDGQKVKRLEGTPGAQPQASPSTAAAMLPLNDNAETK
nr:efflux RND transporter periplasmic adaptor subunit [Pseudomonas sp.]